MGVAVMIEQPAIIMALYDIGRDNWSNFTVSYHTYLHWMKNTLSLDANIVIYSEQKFIDTIKTYRKEFDPDFKKTIIVECPLEELECYKKYYNSLSNLMFSQSFRQKVHHDVPEMTKPLYNIIMFNKAYFIKHAKDNNYFNADLYIWADAGGLRESIDQYKNRAWPCLEKINELDNNKITFFTHSKDISIHNNEAHAMSQMRYIQGTCFFVPSHLVEFLVTSCDSTIDECIQHNYIGSDEKIFDITYLKDPNKYNLISCTWRTYFKLFKNGSNISKIFIDLGAYEGQAIGHFIHNELRIDNDWEIHAFEPNPLIDTEKHIQKYNNNNIKVYKKAAWIRDAERIAFNRYGTNGTSQGSLMADSGGGKGYGDFFDSIYVPAIDIIKFIKLFDSDLELYIKIDIEFSEYIIIDHLLQSGWPSNIKIMWIAWHDQFNDINKDKIQYFTQKITECGTIVKSWQ